MLDLVLFCLSVATGFYLFYWYRSDLARDAEARQRCCVQRQEDDRRRIERFQRLGRAGGAATPGFQAIRDTFQSHAELLRAVRRSGLRRLRAVLGVDFSASNEWQGNRSFSHQSLHKIVSLKANNPYQRALAAVGRALEPLIDGREVYAYGFGDAVTKASDVFPLRPDGQSCAGFREVLAAYSAAVRSRRLGGPTSLRPLILRGVQHAEQADEAELTLLVIVSDGQLPSADDTVAALVEASSHPLSIVLVGVGDGPWDTMEALDDFVPARKFDNFQFVDFAAASANNSGGGGEVMFSLHLLMEVPEHFRLLCERGYIKPRKHVPVAGASSSEPVRSLTPGAPHGWPRVVRVESSPTRVIAGDPTPRLRRKVMSIRS